MLDSSLTLVFELEAAVISNMLLLWHFGLLGLLIASLTALFCVHSGLVASGDWMRDRVDVFAAFTTLADTFDPLSTSVDHRLD